MIHKIYTMSSKKYGELRVMLGSSCTSNNMPEELIDVDKSHVRLVSSHSRDGIH